MIGNRRNKHAVSVLNKLDIVEDNPIGLIEGYDNPSSANFGVARDPRKGGCYKGDGTAYVDCGYKDIYEIQNYSISFYLKIDSGISSNQGILAFNGSLFDAGTGSGFNIRFVNNQKQIRINIAQALDAEYPLITSYHAYLNIWNKICFKVYNGTVYLYINDILINYGSNPLPPFYSQDNSKANSAFLTAWYNGNPNSISKSDIEIFNISLDELDTSGNFVQNLAFFKLDENSGTTAYDSSGNGNHGSIINAITVPPEEDPNSIHQYQNIKSFLNDEGFNIDDSSTYDVFIPKDNSINTYPYKDVLGNDLQYFGSVPAKASFKESACFLGDGAAYLSITGLLTTDVITVFGDSDIPTCTVNGILDLANTEKAYGITITRSETEWAYIPMCEPIINPSNHIYYDISGNENHSTLINSTTANEGTQDEFHYLQKGFYTDSSNNYVPILEDETTFADGTLLTDASAVLQDNNSFLNTGCKLQHYDYPSIRVADDQSFWTDATDLLKKSISDFTGVISNKFFSNKSNTNKRTEIRTYKEALLNRELETEKTITNN